MKGNAKVQIQRKSPEYGGDKYFIYLPKSIIEKEKIEAGHTVDFEINNQGKLGKERKNKPFQKNDERNPETPDSY